MATVALSGAATICDRIQTCAQGNGRRFAAPDGGATGVRQRGRPTFKPSPVALLLEAPAPDFARQGDTNGRAGGVARHCADEAAIAVGFAGN